jgi:hypothetical protein
MNAPSQLGPLTAAVTVTDSNQETSTAATCSVTVQPPTYTTKEYIRVGGQVIGVYHH